MIEDVIVYDATVHGFNFQPANYLQPFMKTVVGGLYDFSIDVIHPQGDPRYRLTREQFHDLFQLQPDLLERVLFGESLMDGACYHGVPMYGLFGDGSSPVSIGLAVAEKFPHRMMVYADLSHTHPDPIGWIDKMSANKAVRGVKFYPADFVKGEIVPVRLDDEKNVIPLIEHCAKRGITRIAVHKATPLGPIPRQVFDVADLAPVIKAFPHLQFEIVHGGFAYADETADLFDAFDNVWINLESVPCFVLAFADKFAGMIAPLVEVGKPEKIFWSTGAVGMHPQPFIEPFLNFEMPKHYPQLSREDRANMLGANFLRYHGLDVEAFKAACAKDKYGLKDKTLAAPWSLVHERAAA